jgi:ubiquitin-conjugating enzyme E2 variant
MGLGMRPLEQRPAATLAGTPKVFRLFEIACVVAFPPMWISLLVRTWRSFETPSFTLLAVIAGSLTSDFISGIFHWFFDTWFTPDTPFIGRSFVRTFREHHVDPTAICRHDFVETNGSNIFSGCVLVTAGYCVSGAFCAASLLFAAVFMSLTSQIHKWAHADRVPPVVAVLQKTRLILPRRAHALHHVAPFSRNYCITSGWLNEPLHQTRFFVVLEHVISTLTGAVPRRDDTATVFSERGNVDSDARVVVSTAQERFVNERARDFGGIAADASDQR